MTIYNVHIYRELRLVYSGIEADTHEAAAAIARDRDTEEADSIDDCDGDTFAALVDVEGDEDYTESRDIAFEAERERKAVPKMRSALEAVVAALAYYPRWLESMPAHLQELAEAVLAEATPANTASDGPAAVTAGTSSGPATTLELTRELAVTMSSPAPDVIYSPHSFCSMEDINQVQWTHPDEQYVIVFDRATEIFTGHYYDWDEETQDWKDTDPMTAGQIKDCIERNRLLFAR